MPVFQAGVLLEGPPGTGKTLLGQRLREKLVYYLFSISGSDFVEINSSVSVQVVRSLRMPKAAPAIIFIDEIDAVGRQTWCWSWWW